MKMTVTRGLSELKLLYDRIVKKINDGAFVEAYRESSGKVNGTTSISDFEKEAESEYDSIIALIERRKKIKEAIVDSNAKTMVEINGKQMTVASAIERKESIELEIQLLETLKTQFDTARFTMNEHNETMHYKLDELLKVSFGKEGKHKINESEIEAISKPYIEQNRWVLADPLGVEKLIKKLEEDISGFLAEVDYVLSISNATTFIEIED